MKTKLCFLLIPLAFVCFALPQTADGGLGSEDTAYGSGALANENGGYSNSAFGFDALYSNTTGSSNTATGSYALISNTTGYNNTANGDAALQSNTTGIYNTTNGGDALFSNTTGNGNTANGAGALSQNTTGHDNIALGVNAGQNLTTGANNIDIGNQGVGAEASTIRIGTQGTQTNTYVAGIYQAMIPHGLALVVDSTGHVGTKGSSARFKEAIKPMDKASEVILALKPVTFRYKKEIDPRGVPQFGLIAEEVKKVNPELVVRDKDGNVNTVRYDAVNAMLLNEFLKEHKEVEAQQATINRLKSKAAKQEATVSELRKEIGVLTARLKDQAAQIQRVSAQSEMSRSLTRVAVSNP